MYIVLLVDDETPTLDTLRNNINWHQLGVKTVLTAFDGLQAMEILSKVSVDLLITDIKMPHMDGISLLKFVRTQYPDTHCILLSAYTEFEFARQAIQLGAENYLLKPLQKGELEESIERALDNIYTNRKNSQQLFRNNVFTRWIKGTISGNELADRANLLNINLFLPEYRTLILHKKRDSLSLSSYCQACVKQFENSYDVHHFKDDDGYHVFVIGGNQISTSTVITHFAEEANRLGIGHLIVLAVGKIVFDPESLSSSYQFARNLLNGDSVTSCQSNHASGITVFAENVNTEHDEFLLTQHLGILFESHDKEESSEKFHQLAATLSSKTLDLSPAYVKAVFSHSLLRLFLQEFPNYPQAQEQLTNRIRMFNTAPDTDSLQTSILDLLDYGNFLYRYYTNLLHPLVKSATQYIHDHYAESISIQEYCSLFKTSAPYLGFLFKKETGYFFNSYLSQYRVCRSIPLLLDSDFKVSDIALKVGFTSVNYYITCFKQQTGFSPTKYRTYSR